MKNPVNITSRMMLLSVLAAMLFISADMKDALAQAQVNGDCKNPNNNVQFICENQYKADGVTPCVWTSTDPQHPEEGMCTPEMSDYLAAAFLLIAGGMIYHFRNRTVKNI